MKYFAALITLSIVCVSNIDALGQANEYKLDKTYAIEQGATIHLQSNDAEVTIRGTDREDVHLVVYRSVEFSDADRKEKFKMKVDNQGSDLYIKEDRERENNWFSSVNIEQEEYRIRIEAPREVALNIRGDDDHYEISDINLTIRLDADDTEVRLRNLKGQRFQLSMDDGHIDMDQGRGKLMLDMDDGYFDVDRGDFEEIRADADDGEMHITTSLASSGYYHFDMDDGDLSLNITSGGGRFSIEHDDASIRQDASFNEIRNEESRSEYRLPGGNAIIKIQTDDGRIDFRKAQAGS